MLRDSTSAARKKTPRHSSRSANRGRAPQPPNNTCWCCATTPKPLPISRGTDRVKAPVRRVVCMSSSHVAMFDAVGQVRRVAGVSGIDYISNPDVRKHRLCGEVRDVGYDTNLDFELLAAMCPDIILLYGVTGENTVITGKLRELNIPYIYIGDYVEESPLGKAEWLVVAAGALRPAPGRRRHAAADRPGLRSPAVAARTGRQTSEGDAEHPLPRHVVHAVVAQLHDPPYRGRRRGIRLYREHVGRSSRWRSIWKRLTCWPMPRTSG